MFDLEVNEMDSILDFLDIELSRLKETILSKCGTMDDFDFHFDQINANMKGLRTIISSLKS